MSEIDSAPTDLSQVQDLASSNMLLHTVTSEYLLSRDTWLSRGMLACDRVYGRFIVRHSDLQLQEIRLVGPVVRVLSISDYSLCIH